jgi:predicted N-acetyltransferase YhbS
MGTSQIIVRQATRSDAKELVRVLARAFDDDPLMVWMLPDPASRQRRIRRMFHTIFRHEVFAFGGARVATEDGRIVGAALWIPPRSSPKPSVVRQLMALPGFLRAFGRQTLLPNTYLLAALKVHPHEKHWYLYLIGVDPDQQGKGVGAALLRERLRHCDTELMPAYLESSKLSNVPVYEHFGFEATGTLALAEGAPAVTTMWRTPQP